MSIPLRNGLIGVTVFVIDRITKYYALSLARPYVVGPFLSFDLLINRGISWGFFHSDSDLIFGIITALILITVGILGWYMWICTQSHVHLGYTLILSGALSNCIDRIYYAGVIDFIAFHYGSWHFPIFNVADCAICIGVALLIMQSNHA